MNDIDTAMSNFERHRRARAKLSQSNKGVVFDALVAANITLVQVQFDGEGDEGQIESVIAFRGEERVDLATTTISIQNATSGDAKPVTLESTLEDAIETLCYDCLEETHGGWENNEGAYGEFRLDVAERSIKLEFNQRFIDASTSTHTF
jgi:hypothetical protein